MIKREVHGAVALIEYESGRWKIDYFDPHANERVRLRLSSANTYPEALADAESHNRYIRGDIEVRPDKRRKERKAAAIAKSTAKGLSISEAMKAAEVNLEYRENSLKKYRNDCTQFETYARDHHKVTQWADVQPSMIVAFIQHMNAGGLSHNRARLCLLPVRITSEHWHAEKPEYFRDVYGAKRKEIKRFMKPKLWPEKAEAVALTHKQTVKFLNFLYTEFPLLYPMARLSVLTGLRVYECAWIRAMDIDRENLTMQPRDTELHELKTEKSDMLVPIPACALDGIHSWPDNPSEPIFRSLKGRPWQSDHLDRSWWRACKAARESGYAPEGFTAKSLRATFATNLAAGELSELFIQRCMRQAPTSVLSDSYTKISVDEMRLKLARIWQTEIYKKYKPKKIKVVKAD